jgi:hemerythrin
MVTWSEDLRTGVAEIDEQHQLLFRRAAVVREAVQGEQGTDEVKAAIDFLADYAAVHFDTEARYMRLSAFPHVAAHLAEHATLVRRLELATEIYEARGASPMLADDVAEIFETWLEAHIQEHDKVLATWLQLSGGSGAGAP